MLTEEALNGTSDLLVKPGTHMKMLAHHTHKDLSYEAPDSCRPRQKSHVIKRDLT